MKPNLKLLAVCPLLLGLSPLIAQEAPFDPLGEQQVADLPKFVRIQVEFIEMPLTQMTTLMADATATKSDTILRQHVAELVKANKAKIIETQMLIARSGEKSSSESIREFIYPTEYEPPELPNTIHLHVDKTNTTLPTKKMATGPTPTAFETRNLGSTLEIEPLIGEDSKIIDLRLSPELVYHVENTIWTEWKDEHGEANIQMPVIYTLRVSTAVTLAPGRPCLIAALSPKDEKGVPDFSRKVLLFVKGDVITVGR